VEHSYEAAGVSLAKAGDVVERLRAAVESTGAQGFGAFAGLHPLDDRRLLAASTDGVGTKLTLARQRGRLRACGADLAAHCINDVITTGAEPLMLLDYVAAGRIELEQVAELVEGAAEVCRAAGCALVGGETAELPGIYREEELDFAGTCVGIVDRDALIDGSRVEAGDAVIGLASAGVHANGFTLIRRVLEQEDYDGDDLLAPTRLYLDDVHILRRRCDVRALAHVTGGGILGNVQRVLPDGLRAEIDWNAWERPTVFHWLARHVEEDELQRVFNLGIGFCAVVRDPGAEVVIGRIVRT
jgi:phosphoribosylformylglycinamidine cyclo-ligase